MKASGEYVSRTAELHSGELGKDPSQKPTKQGVKPQITFDWRLHAPKRGRVAENLEVVSITSSAIRLKDEKIVAYRLTSRTKVFDTDDRLVSWKTIKRGDHVTVLSPVRGNVALILLIRF